MGGSHPNTHITDTGMCSPRRMRSSSKVAIYIDVRRALSGGLQFFESDNGVVMCKHVPVEYFSHVVDLHSGERLM